MTDEERGELWKAVVTTFLSMQESDDERMSAERLFSMVSRLEGTDKGFRILTRNEYSADLLSREYSNRLKTCLSLLSGGGSDVTVEFAVDAMAKPDIVMPKDEGGSKRLIRRACTFISTMPLNEDYTFDEFVEGPSNSWAYAAAKGVARSPGEKGCNPLFIHGGTGLGKTHLMQAIGHAVRTKDQAMSICYLTAETYLNEYVNSMQNKNIDTFREKYRAVDVLLVDDVQFLQKGKMCQEEFFNTFNALIGKHKQIVMTSDVAPKDLVVLEQRLVSRFEGGMVQEIESPSYETRLAILRKKAAGMSPAIPDACIKFIAERIKSHVRAMEGALGKVRIMLAMNGSIQLNDEMLSRLLKDFIEKEKRQKRLTIDDIQAAVANRYSVSVSQILSVDKSASIVTPRQLAMYIARKFTDKSLGEIAVKFERTHATIIHGVKAVANRIDVEQELKETLEAVVTQLGCSPDDRVG